MRVLPPAYIGLLLFVLILGLSLSNAPVFGDADTPWHLAAGDLIRAAHHIPYEDPWSFTASGERWYNLSWLFDMGASAVFALGGFSALYALTLGVLMGTLAFMAHLCIRRGASPLVVFLLLLPALLVLWGGTSMRPAMCSIPLTVAFYAILHRYRDTGLLCNILTLPPLMALWVNLHGGFLLAFLVMGIFLFEAAWEGTRKQRRDYGLAIALCLVATLINPYGFELYYGAYRTLTTAFDQTYIAEWQPTQIGHNWPVTILLMLVLVSGNSFDKRIPLCDRILTIVMMMLSLSGVRYSIFAVLLLYPTLSLRLTHIFYGSKSAERLRTLDTGFMQDMRKNDMRIGTLLMALAAFIFISTPYPRDAFLDEPVGFSTKKFPTAEAEFIAKHYPHSRFLNDYNLGGYLDYLWRGKVKVFVDGRASSLYSEDLLKDYAEFVQNAGYGGRARMVAAEYRLDGIILSNAAENASLWAWNPDWKAVYRGKVATVYLRRGLEDRKWGTGKQGRKNYP